MNGLVTDAELAELEGRVERALVTGDAGSLRILGYGEITLVLGWPAAEPRAAAKRLPVFADASRAAAYGSLVEEYVARLADSGIDVLPTEWQHGADRGRPGRGVRRAGGAARRDPRAPAAVGAAAPGRGGADGGARRRRRHRRSRLRTGCADLQLGVVGRLAALLRRHHPDAQRRAGRPGWTSACSTSPLPAAARPLVARYVAPGIVGAYHDLRGVVVDLVGNLLKERLDGLLDTAIALGNERVTPAITRTEIDRWYATDARMWEVLLRLRRADRWWQRRVRRRTYPFLLPGAIER